MAGPTTYRPGCKLGGKLKLPGLGRSNDLSTRLHLVGNFLFRGLAGTTSCRHGRKLDGELLLRLMLRNNITNQTLIKLMREPPHPWKCQLRGTQIPAHQLGGETRARKPSSQQGFHFIRYINSKMNNYTAGQHRTKTLFLHQNWHRKHRLYAGTLATSPDSTGQQVGQHLINF